MMETTTSRYNLAELSKLLGVTALSCLLSWSSYLLLYEVWPSGSIFLASGLALAALLIGGKRYLWAVWLGGFLANLLIGQGLWVSALVAFSSAMGTLVAARWIIHNSPFDIRLLAIRDILKIYIWGAVASSVVCATLGATTLLLAGVVSSGSYFTTLLDWWMLNSLSIILITPLVLKCWPTASNPYSQPPAKIIAEASLIFTLTALFGAIIFLEYLWFSIPLHMHDAMRVYLLFIFTLWAALRLELKGVDFVTLIIAILALFGAKQGTGFFANTQGFAHLGSYWLYIVIITLTGMLLSIYIKQNKISIQLLAESEASISTELKNLSAALNLHSIVCTVDSQGCLTYVNDNFSKRSGYSRDEMLGMDNLLINSGINPKNLFRDISQTVATKQVWMGEICKRAKDGSFFWLKSTISLNPDSKNNRNFYSVISTDITEHKNFEKTLQTQRNFYERISETLGEGLYVQDANGDCIYLNNEGEKLLGWSREEFIGMPVHNTIHTVTETGDALALNDCVIDKYNHSGKRINCKDQVFVHRDGSVFPVSVVSQGIFEDGKYCGAVVAFDDITTNKAHEKELLLHREHLEELVQQKTTDLMHSTELTKAALAELEHQKFVLDQHAIVTVTNIENNIVYGNDKFCEISGYSREEFIGKNHRIMNSGVHPDEFFKNMYETLGRGEIWKAEVCNKAKNGELYWLDTTVVPFFDADGKVQHYIAVRNDITQRKAAEIASKAASQAKSEFLANMSHEIRTPMNGVVGMLDILQQTSLSLAQHRMINTINDSSLLLLQIINDILDFSKIEAGKLAIENIPTHLREISEGATKLMAPAANKNSTQLFVFVSPDLPCWVMSDATRLRQILYNLLSNALKFANSKNGLQGRVTLYVDSCSLADGRPGVKFCVTDNGIGMSEETLNKLFQPFTQADGSTARKFGGTGLGLSIVHRLATLMDGQISVRSTLGEGSEFSVILPLQKTVPMGMQVFETSLLGVHVLCASSDAMIIEIVSAYCSAAGAQVTLVADMAAAHQQPPLSLSLSSMHVVVVQDDDASSDLDLPANIGIVRLKQLNENHGVNEISINANPLFYAELIRSVSLASTKHVLEYGSNLDANYQFGKSVMMSTVEQSQASNHLILLAEDNEINREVMLEQLHILGYTAELAEDGVMALKMWQTGRYSLLLTDCHMPNMDGFELTALIRKAEPEGTHLPIIAVTANAMHGEAQNCITQGMDGYLSKPLRLAELASTLSKWLPNETIENTRHEEAEAATGQIPQTEPTTESTEVRGDKVENQNKKLEQSSLDLFAVWDVTTLPGLLGNNPTMILRLRDKFLHNTQAEVATIVNAAAAGEISVISDAAHKLKSSARTVGAMQLGDLCHKIEDAGRAGDEKACHVLVEQLNGVFAATEEAIKENMA